jgi:hypothetical protein
MISLAAEHIADVGETRNAYKMLVGNPERRSPDWL